MNRSGLVFFVLISGGIGLLVLAGFLALSAYHSSSGLIVEKPHRIIDDLIPGSSQDVDFEIQNRTDRTLRIIGTNSL